MGLLDDLTTRPPIPASGPEMRSYPAGDWFKSGIGLSAADAVSLAMGLLGPMRLYHGTYSSTPIEKFKVPTDYRLKGVWLTPSKQYAAQYGRGGFKTEGTGIAVGRKKKHVIPTDVTFQNPLDLRNKSVRDSIEGRRAEGGNIAEMAKAMGHDGIIFSNGEYLAIKPGTVKSAITGGTMFGLGGLLGLGGDDGRNR